MSITNADAGWYRTPLFGLPVLIACFFGMASNVGPLIYASFAFIVSDLESEFGWSRSDMTLSVSLLTMVSAAVHPSFGKLVDRFGVRRTLLPSFILMAFSLGVVPFYLNAVWQLWLAFGLAAILGVANNNLCYIRLTSAWFDKRRGFMLGLIASGTGVGLAVLPKITESVVSLYGWQGGFYFYGLFILCASVPVMFLLIRDTPESLGLNPDGDDPEKQDASPKHALGLTLGQTIRTRCFWVLLLGILFASFALWGFTNQMGLVLMDRGYSSGFAASVAVFLGLSMAAARLVIGYLLDKVFAPIVGGFVFMLTALGFAIMIYLSIDWTLFVAAAMLGTGLGAETELLGFMVSRYFGLRRFGTIYGILFVGFLLGTSGGPYMYARTEELFGSYDPALKAMVVLMAVTAVMFASMGRYDRYHRQFAYD